MKSGENIRLAVLATLFVGFFSSLLLFAVSLKSSDGTNQSNPQIWFSILPFLLAGFVAYVQQKVILASFKTASASAPKKNPEQIERKTERKNDPDISELKSALANATEQIEDARQRERTFVQHAVDVICVIDLKGTLLSVNPASKSVWGYKPDELVGKQITDFIVSEDVNNTLQSLMGAEKSIDKIYFENRFRKKSGQIVDMLWSAHVSASDRGLFCIAHDITDRKRAEQLLKESEERVRGILESLPAGVAVLGPDGQLEFMNKTALDLTAYELSNLSSLQGPAIFSFCKGSFAKNLKAGQISFENNFDCQIVRSSGERFPAEASTRSIRWREAPACLVIFMDATMKHELERAKREFVAMVSHDLRTPLTSIHLIFASMLDGFCGDINEQGTLFAERGRAACDRLILLVQDLLDLEKMKAGKWAMDITETPIRELALAAVDAVERYAQAQEVRLSLNCPDLTCYCDGGRVIQVLINLIGNAIKFSYPDGTVEIDVKDGDSHLTFTVSNKGRKIPPDKLQSIFEKFEQADSNGTVERKGTGLGLAISKSIVEQHGGEIWAESSDTEGTKFSFTIPKFSEETDESLLASLENA